MKQITLYTSIVAVIMVALASCSRKSDSFINRNLHAVGTQYNTLYNGNLALQAGLDEIDATYRDDYWKILPVERLSIRDENILAEDQEPDPNFKRAEDKAVKAVQRHGMQVDGQEVNPQIDEAFMLLGKARYYDQRFIPSLEAFNYILQFMPESDELRMAKIWREKTNIRLENSEIAIENLHNLLTEDSLEINRKELTLAYATLSQAYLNLDKTDSALIYMNRAAQKTDDRNSQGRYKYIAGQLFAATGQRDSAMAHFDQVIELHRKIPRNYYVNAFIEKIKLRDSLEQGDEEFLALFQELEDNRENRPFLDIINYRKAVFLESIDSLDAATRYYNLSLTAGGQDEYLKGNSYDALGRLNFNDARFENAGKYFDSAATSYIDKSREKRSVLKKRENLAEVILYENNRRSADSILSVVALDDKGREEYYNNYIEQLRQKEQQLAEQAAIEEANLAQQRTALSTIRTSNQLGNNRLGPPVDQQINDIGPQTQGGFYFYIPTTVARGKLQFRSIWGNRQLGDNWRWSSITTNIIDGASDGNTTSILEGTTAPEYLASYYIDQLPLDPLALDSIASSRNLAYYQLGVLYKERYKRPDLAVQRFETLLDQQPEEKLLLPTLYNLYLMNSENEGNDSAFAKAEYYKNLIISQYPQTRYAQILQNPEGRLDTSESAEGVYNKVFKLYKNEQFTRAEQMIETQTLRFAGDPVIPKFELLKAFIAARLYGLDSYKKALDFVALTYPSTQEGKEAVKLAADANAIGISNRFVAEDSLKSFKLLYLLKAQDTAMINELEKQLQVPLASFGKEISYSIDVYRPETSLLVIHGMNKKERAAQIHTYLSEKNNKVKLLPLTPIIVATDNYKVIQVYKNLDDYLNLSP